MAIAAPLLAPVPVPDKFPPFKVIDALKGSLPAPPNPLAPLGTVTFPAGRRQLDVWYTLVWGSRSALRFGFTAAFFTALIGVLVGAVSAFFGGWLKNLLMRLTDAFLAFPIVAGVVFFQQLLVLSDEMNPYAGLASAGSARPPSLLESLFTVVDPVLLALVLFSWMPFARLTYTQVLRIRQTEFVQAAQALGAAPASIIFRHLIPNSLAPIIVSATLGFGGVIIAESALSFLGFGIMPPVPTWGNLLNEARAAPQSGFTLFTQTLSPGLCIFLTVLSINFIGDGLRDALDPRLKL
jgi:peptide/nickel transport system permease protein